MQIICYTEDDFSDRNFAEKETYKNAEKRL